MNKTITLHQAIKAYMKHLEQSGKSPRTLYTYGKDLEQIQQFFGENRKLSNILKPHVGKFLRSDALLTLPKGKPRALQTVQKTCRVLRMFLHWAQTQGLLQEIPLPKINPHFSQRLREESV